MSKIWVIVGASSIIAREFANLIAKDCHEIILVGRNTEDINTTKADLMARYQVKVTTIATDLTCHEQLQILIEQIIDIKDSLSFYLGHALTYENKTLNPNKIKALIDCNVTATATLIDTFIQRCQKPQVLIYISSVAGDRGREKNSLYGASKKMIDIYIDGLRISHQNITFITPKLGFIDTKETYGKAGIFYAAAPKKLAKFLLKSIKKKREKSYYPFFWRYLIWIIKMIPTKIFNKLKI